MLFIVESFGSSVRWWCVSENNPQNHKSSRLHAGTPSSRHVGRSAIDLLSSLLHVVMLIPGFLWSCDECSWDANDRLHRFPLRAAVLCSFILVLYLYLFIIIFFMKDALPPAFFCSGDVICWKVSYWLHRVLVSVEMQFTFVQSDFAIYCFLLFFYSFVQHILPVFPCGKGSFSWD